MVSPDSIQCEGGIYVESCHPANSFVDLNENKTVSCSQFSELIRIFSISINFFSDCKVVR